MPPFGHTTHLRVFIDPDLLQWPEVWAAAGTWNDVFGIEPHERMIPGLSLVSKSPTNSTSAGGDHFPDAPHAVAATVSTERAHKRSALPASSAYGITPDQGLFCIHGAAWAQSSR